MNPFERNFVLRSQRLTFHSVASLQQDEQTRTMMMNDNNVFMLLSFLILTVIQLRL
jgi:hypothetical protein